MGKCCMRRLPCASCTGQGTCFLLLFREGGLVVPLISIQQRIYVAWMKVPCLQRSTCVLTNNFAKAAPNAVNEQSTVPRASDSAGRRGQRERRQRGHRYVKLDYATLYQCWIALQKEFNSFTFYIGIKHWIGLTLLFYLVTFPMRRISHYNHRTLPDYWPEKYSVPASLATIEINNADGIIETVSLDDLLTRIAPSHGLDLAQISIQKDDFMDTCHGCIDKPQRLFDFGHQWTPDWSNSERRVLSELCMVIVFIYGITFALSLIIQRPPRLNIVSLVVRTSRIGLCLHALRPFFHASTAFPGPAMHCQSKVVKGGGGSQLAGPYLVPENDSLGSFLVLLFTSTGDKSCGDLMFSGHMINATVITYVCVRYVDQVYSSRRAQITWVSVSAALFCIQAFLILCARNHYTVDIVGSVVLVIVCGSLDFKLFPSDLKSVELDDTVGACGTASSVDLKSTYFREMRESDVAHAQALRV